MPICTFDVAARAGGQATIPFAADGGLLIDDDVNGIIFLAADRAATFRDVAVHFVAANLRPDHDTVATFRRTNRAAIETAFLQVLLLARETGLLKLRAALIDRTKIDASASKIRLERDRRRSNQPEA